MGVDGGHHVPYTDCAPTALYEKESHHCPMYTVFLEGCKVREVAEDPSEFSLVGPGMFTHCYNLSTFFLH